jgi:tetratricopeptide (TPR) repeat protein
MPNLTSLQSAVRSQLLIFTAGVFSLVTSPVVGQSVTAPQSRQQEAQNVLDEGVQAFKNGRYDEATLDFQRAKQLDPKLLNASLYLATSDWTLSFRANAQFRAKYNLSIRGKQLEDNEPPPDILREAYAHEYGALIDEGIACLKKALTLRPDYDDAMAYLNLLYRRKADTVPTQAEREQLLQIADDLVDEVKDIKEKRVAQPQ